MGCALLSLAREGEARHTAGALIKADSTVTRGRVMSGRTLQAPRG